MQAVSSGGGGGSHLAIDERPGVARHRVYILIEMRLQAVLAEAPAAFLILAGKHAAGPHLDEREEGGRA